MRGGPRFQACIPGVDTADAAHTHTRIFGWAQLSAVLYVHVDPVSYKPSD